MSDLDNTSLEDVISEYLGDDHACNRVWSAWQYGTMTEDDFEPLSDTPRVQELVELYEEHQQKDIEKLAFHTGIPAEVLSGYLKAREDK